MLSRSQFAQSRSYFPLVWAHRWTTGFGKPPLKICFTAMFSLDRSLCPSVGTELVNWLMNKNASQKNLDKIAKHDLMQERGQTLKGQRDDRWYFTLLRVLQLFAGGWWAGEGQIPVAVYQETMSTCHVEVPACGGVHQALCGACRNTLLALQPWGISVFMVSQAAGTAVWIYGETEKPKADEKSLFCPPLLLVKMIPQATSWRRHLAALYCTVADCCKRCKAHGAGWQWE